MENLEEMWTKCTTAVQKGEREKDTKSMKLKQIFVRNQTNQKTIHLKAYIFCHILAA